MFRLVGARRYLLLLALAGSTGSLPAPAQSPASAAASVPTPRVPLVIGHAGSGFFTLLSPFNPLPPSSLRSIARALRQGAAGVEVDVRLSQDSIPVIYHNETLETMSTGQGCVSQTPAAALTQLRYRGGWPYDWFQHEQLTSFETLLQQLSQRPEFPYLHLDLHEDDPCAAANGARSRALVRGLVQLLRQYQVPLARVTLITNRPATLAYARRLRPDLPLGLEITGSFEQDFPAAGQTDVEALVLRKNDLTPARAAQIHALGKQVIVFGGRSRKAIGRVAASQPDAYEVDSVRRLRATLRRQPPAQ